MSKAKRPVQDAEVEQEIWYRGTDREILGQALCDVGGPSKVGFWTLHLGSEQYPLQKGSYINFPAGQAIPHFVSNTSDAALKYIMVGERIEDDEVVYAVAEA